MTAEDAELAIANGADAIWVSNHGMCAVASHKENEYLFFWSAVTLAK